MVITLRKSRQLVTTYVETAIKQIVKSRGGNIKESFWSFVDDNSKAPHGPIKTTRKFLKYGIPYIKDLVQQDKLSKVTIKIYDSQEDVHFETWELIVEYMDTEGEDAEGEASDLKYLIDYLPGVIEDVNESLPDFSSSHYYEIVVENVVRLEHEDTEIYKDPSEPPAQIAASLMPFITGFAEVHILSYFKYDADEEEEHHG